MNWPGFWFDQNQKCTSNIWRFFCFDGLYWLWNQNQESKLWDFCFRTLKSRSRIKTCFLFWKLYWIVNQKSRIKNCFLFWKLYWIANQNQESNLVFFFQAVLNWKSKSRIKTLKLFWTVLTSESKSRIKTWFFLKNQQSKANFLDCVSS